MSKFPRLSAGKIIKILVDDFGFQASWKPRGFAQTCCRKIVTIVPMHKQVKVGTIFGILSLGEIKKEDFLKKL